jgi:BirA family biotin operon repressor/biotin-[acetyl-CoA-carboxylase] ligase
MLDLNAVNHALAQTIFADRLQWFAQIDSTNLHAMQQGREGALHGSVYVAGEQTAGRGRGDHQWHSAAGQGLYMSVLVRPKISAEQLVWLPLLAGLALHHAILETTALVADLRWPNDMLLHGRKCAGILVEAQTDAAQGVFAVIGIGVNLHQRRFPAAMATPATSLDLETGRVVENERLLIALLQSLHVELSRIDSPTTRAAHCAAIPSRLEAISTWIHGKSVTVHGPQQAQGVTAGLDTQGFLRLRTENGMITITTGGLRERNAPC